uniref:Uncharacterized protein TCIL3000_10_11180 n=1 Tax=Trypanosoma congolense (strain IL3000) TaxID=1068625 RepID=G0UY72_TRYCI|nr:unnamed protein product [Trypanosoma congolense IL3000]
MNDEKAASKQTDEYANAKQQGTQALGVEEQAALVPRNEPGQAIARMASNATPAKYMTCRYIAGGALGAGINTSTTLLLSASVARPVAAVAVVAYESIRAISDYRRGALNVLGCRTDLADVALRITEEVGTAATGLAIGYGVGALIGLAPIPAIGQLIASTVLSVALSFCVGTLLTRYADRIFTRLRLRSRYGYSSDEECTRKRFEELLQYQHCLLSFETCRIVQHYRDYRVSCGWEGASDVRDYRASADITMMPVSFQHFAIVQLQRKWGFVNERDECRNVYKALLLVHHPDRGGSSELTAVLNHDFEVYAFCQGWHEYCHRVLQTSQDQHQKPSGSPLRKRKKNVIVDFLRSIFRTGVNTSEEEKKICESGFLELEAGTPQELSALEQIFPDSAEDADRGGEPTISATRASTTQHSVCAVLASIQRYYQLTTEAISFGWLVQLHKKPEEWSQLKANVYMFMRVHTFVHIAYSMVTRNDCAALPLPTERSCCGFQWGSEEEAVGRREELRRVIVETCFPKEVSTNLLEALELWQMGQTLAHNFFKQGHAADGDASVAMGTGQTISTLLDIQNALQALAAKSAQPFEGHGSSAGNLSALEFVDEVKIIGYLAGLALAGMHAVEAHGKLQDACEEYYKVRSIKMESIASLQSATGNISGSASIPSVKGSHEVREQGGSVTREGLLLHQIFTEVDIATSHLYDMCSEHLPERRDFLNSLPSSCARCVQKKCELPRNVKYERERTLMSYMRVLPASRNALEPCRYLADWGPVSSERSKTPEIEFTLLCADYVDPIKGVINPCWLKRYTFPEYGTDPPPQALLAVKDLMERELRLHAACATHRVTSSTEVFSSEHTKQMFFHVPRGRTQMRFDSTQDITRKIGQLGARWLLDALQAIIDIHSCQLVHGDINISNFTHDDFGNTTLGFFSNSLNIPNYEGKTAQEDASDFGAMLHADVLPYLQGALTSQYRSADPTSDKTGGNAEAGGTYILDRGAQHLKETFRVFMEVADRLIGKLEPRWSLLDARGFVRQFIKVSQNYDERSYLLAKEVTYPVYWAMQKNMGPVSLSPNHRLFLCPPPKGTTVFLNRNTCLWEAYWKYRQRMVQVCGCGSFAAPAVFKELPHFLPCSDDYEVNERFLWYTCSEEEAWKICLEGSTGREYRLCFSPPWSHLPGSRRMEAKTQTAWGIVFRVALGTVVESEKGDGDRRRENANGDSTPFAVDEGDLRAGQRCILVGNDKTTTDGWEVLVPTPQTKCYPEYLICCFHA